MKVLTYEIDQTNFYWFYSFYIICSQKLMRFARCFDFLMNKFFHLIKCVRPDMTLTLKIRKRAFYVKNDLKFNEHMSQ